MSFKNLRRTGLGLALVVSSVFTLASPAAAVDRWCTEARSDQRTPAQKLPRQGVIQVTRFQYSEPSYNARSIEEDGSLGYISLRNHDSKTPLVSAWEPPAMCFGSSGSLRSGGWAVSPFGRVFTGDSTPHFGDMNGKPLNQPIVGMAPTSDGEGYWLVASDGGMFSFGNARFHGSTGAVRLNRPIVAMAATPSRNGYWLAASDGGMFTFGDASFLGSTGNVRLNQPITGMVPTISGTGYWLVAKDGGIFTFGDARFLGSTGSQNLPSPIVGMVPNGTGYTLVAEDGTIYPFKG